MLGTKIENLKKLKENNINIPNFVVVTHEDIVKGNFEINLQSDLYSVRSSANIEDSDDSSFAGLFDTFLNVKKIELKEKIELCLKSLYNESVLEYIKRNNLKTETLKMNVIVQEMICADYSGILFTSNPQGILNESVIVVGKGVGENVVQDKVDTTTYYYNLTDKVYYYEGKTEYLNNEKIEELIEMASKIKAILGDFLDIEFAVKDNIIYILQARKITTINDSSPLILDNSNIVESYPGISLPLTCSFVNSVYGGIFRSVSKRVLKNKKVLNKYDHVFSNMVGNANGRLYYKISNWYTVIKFLPLNKKIIPVWQEMLGVKNKIYDKEKVNIPVITRMMTYFNSVYEILNASKNMKKLNEEFTQVNNYFYSNFNNNMSSKEILKLYNEVENRLLSDWDITLYNDMSSFIFTGLLKHNLKKKYKNYEEVANNYISGISNIESIKPIKALINLSYQKDKISKEEFKDKFNDYIRDYGDRSLEELKMESETFRTNPELLINKINEYTNDRKKLEELYKNINKTKFDNIENENFLTKFYIKKCMHGIKNREISRLNRSRIFGMVREMILAIGNNFEKENIISNQKDIFYLTLDEIFESVEKPSDLRQIIKCRKEEYEIYKLLPTYSRIIFEKNEFNKIHKSINSKKIYLSKNKITGVPCSSRSCGRRSFSY